MSRDAVAAGGAPVAELRVDGGACVNDLLMQFQADLLGIPVVRPEVTETTALGAAYLAGLSCGVYGGLDELAAQWRVERRFLPTLSRAKAAEAMGRWEHAVRRRRWCEASGFRAASSVPRHQEVAADPPPQLVHALEELRQVGVQAGGEDLVDAAVLQVGVQLAGAALRVVRLLVGDHAAGSTTTSFMQACSERGMSARRISSSATRSGVITSR